MMDGLGALRDRLGPRAIGAIVFVLLLPIYALFAHFGQEGRGFVVVSISAVFIAAAYVNAENLRSPLFVSVLALLFATQVAGALFLKIPERFSGSIMIPAAFVDLFLVLAAMGIIEKWGRSRSRRVGEQGFPEP